MAKTKKSIEQRYQKLDDIEHALLRPGMYIGSTKTREDEIYMLDDDTGKFETKQVKHNPGFLKLFGEEVDIHTALLELRTAHQFLL